MSELTKSSPSKEFFEELEKFLPVFVSVIPTYLHSALVFVVVYAIGHILSSRSKAVMDIDGDGEESATEKKMKTFIFRGTSVIVALFFADLTFMISWKLRNRINRKHLVYSRWFPGLLSNGAN